MNMDEFVQRLENGNSFELRRVVERLREGLFDPFGVQLLTAGEARLNKAFAKGVKELADNRSSHLCICGSYGQGKSHSLVYLRERALKQSFVTSLINLDPREIPFHDFRQVYRALVSRICFPDSDDTLLQRWKKLAGRQSADIIPDSMPHFFKAVLTAIARKNMALTQKQRGLKKHVTFRPREFPWLLANALKGESLPVYRLCHALKYRQVSFYRDASLVCKGWEPYFQAVCSLAAMFQNMGYKGWALFFDEGESIGQRPVNIRRKSYEILDGFFSPAIVMSGLYPIFAFTDDFFMQVRAEDYERTENRDDQQLYFAGNYGEEWHPRCHYLHDLSAEDWHGMLTRLISLHARAYGWQPARQEMLSQMTEVMAATKGQEARFKIKALVDQLDIAQQATVIDDNNSGEK